MTDQTSEGDLKAVATINGVVNMIDDAVELLIEKNLERLELKLWQIAAELEYASFLISVNHGLADYYPNLDRIDSNEEALDSLIAQAQEELANVVHILRATPKEAYDRARKATALLRRAQSVLRKTKHQR